MPGKPEHVSQVLRRLLEELARKQQENQKLDGVSAAAMRQEGSKSFAGEDLTRK